MNYSIKPGSELSVSATPGISMDVRLVFADGTIVATTLAPGISMSVTAGIGGNGVNLIIDGANSGSIRLVD